MHNSIFLRLTEYKSDPITEYNKINKLINGKKCYLSYDIYSLFDIHFEKCKLLRPYYVSFEECLSNYVQNLEIYKNSFFGFLDEKIQNELLNEYLDYCEILSYMFSTLYGLVFKNIWNSTNFNSELYLQLLDLIKAGLKSMNYCLILIDEETNKTKAVKINEEAEVVAAQSPVSVKEAILLYLEREIKTLKIKNCICTSLLIC